MKFSPSHRPAIFSAILPVWWVLTVAVLSLAGCGKKSPVAVAPPVPVATESSTAVANQPVSAPLSAPVAVATNPNGGADLKQLNHAYISWIVQSHQRPKTFEEFVAKSGMAVPPAPAGKKYVFSKNGFISLVNQ